MSQSKTLSDLKVLEEQLLLLSERIDQNSSDYDNKSTLSSSSNVDAACILPDSVKQRNTPQQKERSTFRNFLSRLSLIAYFIPMLISLSFKKSRWCILSVFCSKCVKELYADNEKMILLGAVSAGVLLAFFFLLLTIPHQLKLQSRLSAKSSSMNSRFLRLRLNPLFLVQLVVFCLPFTLLAAQLSSLPQTCPPTMPNCHISSSILDGAQMPNIASGNNVHQASSSPTPHNTGSSPSEMCSVGMEGCVAAYQDGGSMVSGEEFEGEANDPPIADDDNAVGVDDSEAEATSGSITNLHADPSDDGESSRRDRTPLTDDLSLSSEKERQRLEEEAAEMAKLQQQQREEEEEKEKERQRLEEEAAAMAKLQQQQREEEEEKEKERQRLEEDQSATLPPADDAVTVSEDGVCESGRRCILSVSTPVQFCSWASDPNKIWTKPSSAAMQQPCTPMSMAILPDGHVEISPDKTGVADSNVRSKVWRSHAVSILGRVTRSGASRDPKLGYNFTEDSLILFRISDKGEWKKWKVAYVNLSA